MKYCAPDLPFLETIVWQGKQIGAALIIGLVIGAIGYGIFYLCAKHQ